jgi:BirA family biotin operon repressor/biotin-[acetyl-CoA-carboxylase] ligase
MVRDPLDRETLSAGAGPWWRVEVKEVTGSTNVDVGEAARRGEAEGLVVFAEEQTQGRGRLGRTWVSPRGKGLWLSMLLRPRVPMAGWGLIPLLTGVALAEAVRGQTGLEVGLKWPNDLLIDERKCAGILAEVASPGAVVVGVGLNVWQSEGELPVSPAGLPATSLALAAGRNGTSGAGRDSAEEGQREGVGEEWDRVGVAVAFLAEFAGVYGGWQGGGRLEGYREKCWTIGRQVRVSLPGGGEITGTAATVDDDGRLVVRTEDGLLCPIAAGDVTHVR